MAPWSSWPQLGGAPRIPGLVLWCSWLGAVGREPRALRFGLAGFGVRALRISRVGIVTCLMKVLSRLDVLDYIVLKHSHLNDDAGLRVRGVGFTGLNTHGCTSKFVGSCASWCQQAR